MTDEEKSVRMEACGVRLMGALEDVGDDDVALRSLAATLGALVLAHGPDAPAAHATAMGVYAGVLSGELLDLTPRSPT